MARQLLSAERIADEDDLVEIVAQFGFPAEQVESIERIPQRIRNVNFRVRTVGRTWVLKRYGSPTAGTRLAFAHNLQRQLAEHAFPLAELRLTTSGTTSVSDGSATYTMHSWVDGTQISIAERDATLRAHPGMVAELGAMLGRFHLLTSGMELPDQVAVAPDRLLEAPQRSLTSIRRGRPPQMFKSLRLRLRPQKSDLDRWILARLPELRRHAKRLAGTSISDRPGASDIVVSHHDINWENLIFDHDFHPRALLDFDNATRIPRDIDLGLTAAVLVGPSREWLEEFLDAYGAAARHTVDRVLVDVGIRLKCARSILWSTDSYLSGRVVNEQLLAMWCSHLYDCLEALPSNGRRSLALIGAMAPALEQMEHLAPMLPA